MQHTRRFLQGLARTTGSMLLVALAGCAGTSGVAGPGAQQPATPGDAPPGARAALASCPEDVWPAGGADVGAVHLGTHEGVSVFALSGSATKTAIVAVGKLRPEGSDECSVQHEDETTALAGSFWPGAGQVQAVLLRPEECHPAFCPGTVLLQGSDRVAGTRRALAAVFWPEACDRALTLARLRWFAGQDSLQLTCHQRTGAAHREIVVILHALPTGLAPVFSLDTGTAEHPSLEERETPGFCPRKPVGWMRLVERGERPRIQVFDPARGEPGDNGAGTGLLADFRFDPGTGRFEQVTPGTLRAYDARAWCRQE